MTKNTLNIQHHIFWEGYLSSYVQKYYFLDKSTTLVVFSDTLAARGLEKLLMVKVSA